MSAPTTRESAEFDLLDKQLIHALQLDPRVAFSRAAEVLAVSEQTVARRYRRLRREGIIRVIGVVNPARIGQSDWLVRIQCRPDATTRLSEALARRGDIGWVNISSGGSEIICAVRSRTQEQRDDLLFQRLPSTAQVLGLTAFVILQRFESRDTAKLINFGVVLSADQVRALTPPLEVAEPVSLTDADEPLLATLSSDGRASVAQLAKVTGVSQGRATRRVAALQASGALYFDVDVATVPLGLRAAANLLLTAAPSRIEHVGSRLAQLPEAQFVAAVTGSANLAASVTCRDLNALYTLVTADIGAIDGVSALEVSPVMRRVKQAGALVDGDRLAHPAPLPKR